MMAALESLVRTLWQRYEKELRHFPVIYDLVPDVVVPSTIKAFASKGSVVDTSTRTHVPYDEQEDAYVNPLEAWVRLRTSHSQYVYCKPLLHDDEDNIDCFLDYTDYLSPVGVSHITIECGPYFKGTIDVRFLSAQQNAVYGMHVHIHAHASVQMRLHIEPTIQATVALYVVVDEQATFSLLSAYRDSSLHSFSTIWLKGAHAQAFVTDCAVLAHTQVSTTVNRIFQDAPSTHATYHCAMVADDEARMVVNSCIVLQHSADTAKARQEIRVLQLSQLARVMTYPQLCVRTSNVQCSHASVVSSLDPEQVWYMASRGFSEKNGAYLLIQAFLIDILKKNTLYSAHNAAKIAAFLSEHYT